MCLGTKATFCALRSQRARRISMSPLIIAPQEAVDVGQPAFGYAGPQSERTHERRLSPYIELMVARTPTPPDFSFSLQARPSIPAVLMIGVRGSALTALAARCTSVDAGPSASASGPDSRCDARSFWRRRRILGDGSDRSTRKAFAETLALPAGSQRGSVPLRLRRDGNE